MRAQADRLLGAALIALAAGVAWHAWTLEVAFSADPVGPRGFPMVVAAAMVAAGAAMAARPVAVWEPAGRVLPGLAATAAMAAYGLLVVPVGFVPATFLLCVAVALAFDARPAQAALVAAVTAPALFLLLDRLLDLPLPRGPLGI